jgi:tetratricopeptide (TPR) repeat protein/DNA-binding Xre family transcriptional regulator
MFVLMWLESYSLTMASRSLRLSSKGANKVSEVIAARGLTQLELAAQVSLARASVANFVRRKPVDRRVFIEICSFLNIDWQEVLEDTFIADGTNSPSPSSFRPTSSNHLPLPFSTYNPKTFTGHKKVVSDLLVKLQGQTRLLWITGMSGIGKTTLGECLASQAWESDASFQWIYLEILEGHKDFVSVAADLLAKLGDGELDPQERNDSDQLAKRLLHKLQANPYWIQIDSLEHLLNAEQPTEFVDAYWATFLQRCLTESNIASRLVLTAQAFPNALIEFSDRYPNVWAEYRLNGLFQVEQQLEFFTNRGVVVEPSNQDILTRIAKIYEGHPLVLKVIAEDILKSFEGDVLHYWQVYQPEFEQVARELQTTLSDKTEHNEALDRKVQERIKRFLKQLPVDALDLLCRSAVFRRPVPTDFWLAMIGDRTPQQQKEAYRVLGDHALIEKEGANIRQHNLIRSVAYGLLKTDPPICQQSKRQAANLWLTDYSPLPNSRNLETVRGYLEAFDYYCDLEDWGKASEIFMNPIKDLPSQKRLHRQLDIWGEYTEEIRLCERLLGKSTPQVDVVCFKGIGDAFLDLSKCQADYQETIEKYQNSLNIALKIGDRQGEGDAIGNLGVVYIRQGKYEEAEKCHKQRLVITDEIGDRSGNGIALRNLGVVYFRLGKYKDAIKTYQKALTVAREDGDFLEEGNALGSLGAVCHMQGEYLKAIQYCQQWLEIARTIGDRKGERESLCNLGETQIKLKNYAEALRNLTMAQEICREINSPFTEAEVLKNLAELHQSLNHAAIARQYCQKALTLATDLGIPLVAECEALLKEIAAGVDQSKLRKPE